jgi:signal transduction histidine kinase
MSGFWRIPLAARLLILSVVLAGAAIVAVRIPEAAHWSWGDLLIFFALAGAVAIAQQFTIPIRHGGETENLDMTDAVWAAGLLLAEPGAITLAIAAGIFAGQSARGWSPYKIAFNVGQDILAITAALLVYGALGTSAGDPQSWVAAALGMGAYFVINAGMVALVISLVGRKSYRSVLLPSAGLNLLQWSANVALGILVAVVIMAEPAALPLLAVPLLLSYLTYRGWLRGVRERELMHEVARTADAISEQGDLDRRVAGAGADDVGQLAATLNRMLDRLETAFRRERRFISEASHELRTPITICRGHLEVLGPNPEPAQLREAIDVVIDELDRLGRIVEDMTTLARVDDPTFLRPREIALDDFMEEVGVKAEALLDGRLTVEAPVPGSVVRGDPHRLTQALLNLLNNAVAHGRGDARVELRVAREPAAWRFEVADEGGGLPANQEESVFRPFHRGKATPAGRGLGLAIVRGVAEAHGGSAGVDNRPGEGATFWIRVPG